MKATNLPPMQLLRQYSREFPQAWRQIARLREGRGKDLPWWPDWCYCPMAGSIAVITDGAPGLGPAEIQDLLQTPPSVMAALAAWRITKGIYRIDPFLLDELRNMPLEGNLPVEIFYSLPEWSIYVETPGLQFLGSGVTGFFAFLEYDVNDICHELHIVFVNADLKALSIPVHLGKWTLAESLRRVSEKGKKNSKELQMGEIEPGKDEEYTQLSSGLAPFLNLVLYICSVNADYGRTGRPRHPSRQPVRKGKIQVANEPRAWEIGVRVGPALQRAVSAAEVEPGDHSHASPRPHYRRAHWHHYWTGPRNQPDKRKMILKWLPPIPVGITENIETPVVIRPIKEER